MKKQHFSHKMINFKSRNFVTKNYQLLLIDNFQIKYINTQILQVELFIKQKALFIYNK